MREMTRNGRSVARLLMLAGLLGLMSVLLAACGGDDPTATSAPPTATTSAADPTPSKAAWEIKWEETLAAAKAEGEVVIAMGGSASRNFAPRFEAFEQEMGIKVIAVTGRGSQQVEKIRSEREAGLYTTDLWMTGVTSTKKVDATGALQDNFLEHIILPDILDTDNWFGGKHWFPNGLEGKTMAFCASPNVTFAYNTDLVDIAELDSYWDLIDGRFKGQIIGILPWEPGQTDGEFYINSPLLGEDFMTKLFTTQDAVYVADAQQGVDALAFGTKSIFMPTGNASDDIDDLQGEGLPVANHFGQGFAEGGVLGIGGSCSASILKDAPNPNAQTVFLNWWYSAENIYEAGGITNDHGLRTDVSTDNLIQDYVRMPGIEYFFPEADPTISTENPGLAFARQVADANGLR